uniref:Salivary protein 15 Iric-3 n=1 Tax=Ixodes ricinus TaxID=34613 RepID=SP153_IXORI|nr:RecName: Full=Salivary protein 15 Iric-3; Short=Salp15 Iric-3; AltName: Full=Salp15-like; Flags: Precursor [Ixodes ricinus]ABU93615.1 Salp15 Iric-3 [Ixodes ricinus]
MESFVAMKVVCIILLFVIAAEAESINEKSDVEPSKGKNNSGLQFKFPPYVPNHKAFALRLLSLCEQGIYGTKINDLKVDFKNCTFLCIRKYENLTLPLPEDTPCGPNNQTCHKKDECVGYIPGC